MSVTRFFERLGAPLANTRWSWGARRASDGAVFLRVWQSEKLIEGGRLHFLVLGDSDENAPAPRLGYNERLKHLEAVRNGAPCYLVMCMARDTAAAQWKIAGFEEESVFLAGRLVQKGRQLWIEALGRKTVPEVLR
jgi:hypothetical protein